VNFGIVPILSHPLQRFLTSSILLRKRSSWGEGARDDPRQGVVSKLGITCSGKQIYTVRHRASWLGKIKEPGVRRRAESETTITISRICLRVQLPTRWPSLAPCKTLTWLS
jgi:hypothetical protein